MKFFLVALSLIAVCHASTTILLSQPALKLASPLALSPALSPLAFAAPAPLTLAAHTPLAIAPHQTLALAPHTPLTYSALAPAQIKYIAQPQIISYAAPAIQPGYVAATRGSLHIAPLPGNTPLASHHLNLEPAPGTI